MVDEHGGAAGPSGPAVANRDFRELRASGEAAGASRAIGGGIVAARDVVARGLIRCGATPNGITLVGCGLTIAAGVCLARGASQQTLYWHHAAGAVGVWPLLACVLLLLSGASDMLDGAVARVGRMGTRAGGVLDSVVDRVSDIAIFLGCFIHFALLSPANLTYQVLAVAALLNAMLISYIKARAENLIPDCSAGYWLRGERFAAVLIGCACGHVPAVLWQLAVSGAFTVWRRATFAFYSVAASEAGTPPPPRGPVPGWRGVFQLARHPRGSVPYDLVTGFHIAYIVFAPWIWPILTRADADPLRALLGG